MMPHDPTLDPYAILAALEIRNIHAVSPVAGGADTSIWRVEHDSVTSALRVFRPSQAKTYAREQIAMDEAARHGVAVPIVRASGYWQDRPALLLSWCAGRSLRDTLQESPWRILQLGRAFGRMQAQIHQVQATALAAAPAVDWIGWYNAADAELQARLRASAGHRRQLLHLDYHPLNVLTHATGVSAVLDWANACAGDPRADLARTYTILLVEPHMPGREPLWYRAARRLLAQTWLAGYRSVAGPLLDMPMFFAWAGAVMAADLAPRVDDPQSWWQPAHLERIRRWTRRWRERV
jgi:aminoglycoside phosphotransferase (APT) family kinase protein